MSSRVNVALVGAGYWGQKLLPKFLAAPQALVRVVCDIHAENRAEIQRKFPEVATAESFAAVIADRQLDAVVIVTPPATHFSLAKKTLATGKHVWVEKPLALRLEEGRELVQLARVKKSVLFVDHTFLYDSAVTMIQKMIRQWRAGRHLSPLFTEAEPWANQARLQRVVEFGASRCFHYLASFIEPPRQC